MIDRLVVVIAVVATTACFRSATGPDAVLGTPFELRVGATSELPDGTRLKFEEVESDSRCPLDAICVTAGNAIVAVTLTPERGAAATRELHTQASGSQISYGSYTIALTELQPYPRASQPTNPANYVATFVVSTTATR